MSGIFDQVINYAPPSLLKGTVTYKGTWSAATNTPTLVNPTDSTTNGFYYVVSAAGTQFSLVFNIGDWIISNGSAWQKVDNTDAIDSVFGRTGAVVGVSTDYSAVGITNTALAATTITATSTIAATGAVTGSNLSGTNTGDQTITLTGGVTGSGTGSFAATVITNANLTGGVTSVGNAATVVTNANLTGDVTSVGNATTLTNAPVIAKVLTGYTSGAGTVAATDSILQAIQKLNGNDATNANLTGVITSVGNATSIASQTGTGSKFVVDTSPTLVTPALGTPSALVGTNITGTASGLTAGNVTTNANLTGDVTSVGNATTLTNAPVIAKVLTGYVSGAGTVAATDSILQAIQKLNGNDATNTNLTGVITSVGNATSIASQTGTGSTFVVSTSPTITSPTLSAPVLGTPTSGTLTNCTFPTLNQNTTGTAAGLSATLAVASGGTGVTISTGSGSNVLSTSPTLVTPILGTPTSGTLTNCTFPTLNQNTTGSSGSCTGNAATSSSCSGNAATATTATNQSGGSVNATTGAFSGAVTFAGGSGVAANGDITARRSSGTSGVVYFGSGSQYIYFDGSNWTIQGGTTVNIAALACSNITAAGAITATGNITAYYSDDRLKNKLGNIENALDKVCSLDGFYYEANETAQALGYKPVREVGLSAQSVQKVLPEVIAPAPIDPQYMTMHYERVIPLLVEAIKELRAEVAALKKCDC